MGKAAVQEWTGPIVGLRQLKWASEIQSSFAETGQPFGDANGVPRKGHFPDGTARLGARAGDLSDLNTPSCASVV